MHPFKKLACGPPRVQIQYGSKFGGYNLHDKRKEVFS